MSTEKPKVLAYLCLQATREGQASFAHVRGIISGLERRGWEVSLFQPGCATATEAPGAVRRAWEFAATQIRLAGSLLSVDLLYIRWHFAAFPTAALARLLRIPVVQEVNGPYEDLFIAWPATRRLSGLFRLLMRLQLMWADDVIAVTPRLAAWASTEGRRTGSRCVTNGADIEHFKPTPSPKARYSDAYVAFFGALARWQGVGTMLEAVQRPEWPANVSLVIAGHGAEQVRIEKAADGDGVIYLGSLPYSAMPAFICGSLACLSVQNNEGGRSETGLFPLKVFEALACGVPVVVSDFPGQADVVRTHACGLVVPPENPDELAKAVSLLASDASARRAMGERGLAAVHGEYSWDRKAAETAEILAEVLRARGTIS
jgi:glycosyltransferase involved in cell wall biosynthesis